MAAPVSLASSRPDHPGSPLRRRSPLVRGALAFGVGFVGAIATIQAIDLVEDDDPVRSRVVVGVLDVDRHCKSLEGEQLTAVLVSSDAFGWRCVGRRNGLWDREPVDFQAACRAQYGERTWAESADEGSPTSWVCVAWG